MKMDARPLRVPPTAARFPWYIKKATGVKYLITGRAGDVGVATLRGGHIVAIRWGGPHGNLTLDQVKELHAAAPGYRFVYVGKVRDGGPEGGVRDNFCVVDSWCVGWHR